MLLTRILAPDFPDCDTFFPAMDASYKVRTLEITSNHLVFDDNYDYDDDDDDDDDVVLVLVLIVVVVLVVVVVVVVVFGAVVVANSGLCSEFVCVCVCVCVCVPLRCAGNR